MMIVLLYLTSLQDDSIRWQLIYFQSFEDIVCNNTYGQNSSLFRKPYSILGSFTNSIQGSDVAFLIFWLSLSSQLK